MATTRISLKQMKVFHKQLGGNARGFYITSYGVDILTGKSVSIEERLAVAVRPSASADYYLVKGKLLK